MATTFAKTQFTPKDFVSIVNVGKLCRAVSRSFDGSVKFSPEQEMLAAIALEAAAKVIYDMTEHTANECACPNCVPAENN